MKSIIKNSEGFKCNQCKEFKHLDFFKVSLRYDICDECDKLNKFYREMNRKLKMEKGK